MPTDSPMKSTANFTDIGLPVEPNVERVETIQYNATSFTLVATLRRAPYTGRSRRIFVRQINEGMYREVLVMWNDRRYFMQPVLSDCAPLAFAMRCDDQGVRARACSIRLPDGLATELPEAQDPTDTTGRSIGLTTVVGASADGASLTVVLIYMPRKGSDARYKIEHKLAYMRADTGEIEVIATLPTPFA